MNNRQENQFTMATSVEGILKDYEASWEVLPAFAESVAAFRAARLIADPEAQKQQQKITSATANKDAARNALTRPSFQMAGNIRAFALRNKNAALANDMDFAESDFTRFRDNVLPVTVQSIINTATQYAHDLEAYGVSRAKLVELGELLAVFKSQNAAPRKSVVSKSIATVNVAAHLKTMLSELEIIDSLVGNFTETAPDFVVAYRKARIVIDLGGRKKNAPAPKAA